MEEVKIVEVEKQNENKQCKIKKNISSLICEFSEKDDDIGYEYVIETTIDEKNENIIIKHGMKQIDERNILFFKHLVDVYDKFQKEQ